MKKYFLLLVLIPFLCFTQILSAESMFSPTWGFYIDIPEGYDYVDGDAKDRFSFSGPEGLMFDLVVYNRRYETMLDLVEDINRRIQNKGDVDFFRYNDKQAAIIKLDFGDYDGWGLAVELESSSTIKPMLLALAYGPEEKKDLEIFHISALDSIAPSASERKFPGPITEYSFPRGKLLNVRMPNGINTMIFENDAEAAQVLIEREYIICQYYLNTPYLQQACIRYYRLVYRDSYDRIKHAANAIVQNLGGYAANTSLEKREFAQKVLSYIQGFKYERYVVESDFQNLVTAITENRGDCDSHAVLFAIILDQANIRSAMMLSHHYSHAMGLADLQGDGARFESHGIKWLVAETTTKIDIGLIAQDLSDPQYWYAILFE